jgi:hypothetical protein
MRSYLVTVPFLLITGVFLYMLKKPKNVRNNNPLNIKESAQWNGESALNLDKIFEEFTAPKYGFRAGYIILLQYLERGDNDINSILHKWAPANTDEKNHTTNYVDYVADKMQMSPVEYVSPAMLPELMLYMSEFEGSGGAFTLEQSAAGVEMANSESFVIARLFRLGEVVA